MDQVSPAQKPRTSFWRFSLRELLLAMLATAAFLGWGGLLYQHFRTFEPTPFYLRNHSWQQDLEAVFEELGEPGFERAAGSATECDGTAAVSRTMIFRVPLPSSKRTPFLNAWEARMRDKIMAAGCHLDVSGTGSGRSQNRVFLYQRGPIGGAYEIWITDVGEGDAGVIVQMREARGEFHTLRIVGN